MPFPLGAAIGLGAGSSLLSYLGANEQADAAGQASRMAEGARQDAMGALSNEQISQLANWFFPGLLPGMGGQAQPRPQATPTAPGSFGAPGGGREPMIPRQQGGPVTPDQQYLVGEQGPEKFVPNQPGTILPNSGSFAGPTVPTGPTAPGAPAANATAPQPGMVPGFTAPATAKPEPPQPSIGALATDQTRGLLENPGQTSPIYGQRLEEQANRNLNTGIASTMGNLSGRGFDPNSGMGQMLLQSNALNAGAQRNEAVRDQALIEETLRREDIQAGSNNYLQFLQTIFGLAGNRAGAASGTGFPQVAPISPWNTLGQGTATLGYLLSRRGDERGGETGGLGDGGSWG